ncbi:MAG: hypothetical protein AABX54_04255 [Nanoarchaeota archaeon]
MKKQSKEIIYHANGLSELVRARGSDGAETIARFGDDYILHIRRFDTIGQPTSRILNAYKKGEDEYDKLDKELLEAKL